jgi:cytochrome c peroxidase
LIAGFVITDEERTDLIAFLNSLTDWEFICDEHFSDPFYRITPHEDCL